MNTTNTASVENPRLRFFCYLAWLAPVFWMLVNTVAYGIGAASGLEFVSRHMIAVVWIMLGVLTAYYVDLVHRQNPMSWAAKGILVFATLGALAAGCSISIDAGITAALSVSALFGFGLSWAGSVGRLTQVSSGMAKLALAVIGILIVPSMIALPVMGFLLWLGLEFKDTSVIFLSESILVLSALVIVIAIAVQFWARSAAKHLCSENLQADCQ